MQIKCASGSVPIYKLSQISIVYLKIFTLLMCDDENIFIARLRTYMKKKYKVNAKNLASNSHKNKCMFYAGLLTPTSYIRQIGVAVQSRYEISTRRLNSVSSCGHTCAVKQRAAKMYT